MLASDMDENLRLEYIFFSLITKVKNKHYGVHYSIISALLPC